MDANHKHDKLPGFAAEAERVGVGLGVAAEGVGGAQVSRAPRPAPVTGLAGLLLPRHAFQQADLLLFLPPLRPVPWLLPPLTLEWVAVAWERGILLWQGVTDISERVTVCFAVLVSWHLALGTPVRATCTSRGGGGREREINRTSNGCRDKNGTNS